MKTKLNSKNQLNTFTCSQLELHYGDVTNNVGLNYSVIGKTSQPVVIVLGGISADHHIINNDEGKIGWWAPFVGAQKTIDTEQYCVISIEYFFINLNNKPTKNPPLISSYDQAELIHRLLVHLNIQRIHTIIGCSYGGMVALAFCHLFKDMAQRLICICAAHRSSNKSIALRSIQRNIIDMSIKNHDLTQGLALARSLAMLGYRGETELEQRFCHKPTILHHQAYFEINRYLQHHGTKFANQFDAEKFMQLSQSIDLHDVDATEIQTETLLIAVNQDQLVPVALIEELHQTLAKSQIHYLDSQYGHDAFLLETQLIADAIQPFIQNT